MIMGLDWLSPFADYNKKEKETQLKGGEKEGGGGGEVWA